MATSVFSPTIANAHTSLQLKPIASAPANARLALADDTAPPPAQPMKLPTQPLHRLLGEPIDAKEISSSGVLLYVAPIGAPSDTVSADYASTYLFSAEKRAFDLIGALVLILLSLPVLVFVACLIKATSRGPVLFRQKRNGAGGRAFTVFKFRSMSHASCLENRVLQATRGDARVTFVGRFIRRTSIDELPQLFNVLKGEMSLIGPRPHAIEHDVFYSARIPHYSWRFVARPGLSGLAQTRGARGETRQISDMERRVILDVEYIGSASLAQDVRIVLATCREMLFSASAY